MLSIETQVQRLQKSTTLAVIGGGPKAAAISAKAKILRNLGIANIEVKIVESHSIGANWRGRNGFTDGLQKLGTPPEKDIGFPYESVFGSTVDEELVAYSWKMFKIEKQQYRDWIDRGRPAPTHQDWAEYITWVIRKTETHVTSAEVQKISPVEDRGFRLSCLERGKKTKLFCNGVVLTGPGTPRLLKLESPNGNEERLLDGRNYWSRIAVFEKLRHQRIAVIGSGETAASILVSLIHMTKEHDVRIDLINRHGTIYTRGESFHENTIYSNGNDWKSMDEFDREEFIRRTDRGVFSVAAQKELDDLKAIHVIRGNVLKIHSSGDKLSAQIQRNQKAAPDCIEYDRIVVAMGFDPLYGGQLFPGYLAPKFSIWRDLCRSVDDYLRIPFNNQRTKTSKVYDIHLPMMAGLAQGPGLPNLSCLGIVSDRILKRYINIEAREMNDPSVHVQEN